MCIRDSANSTEFNPETAHPVIDMMVEQKKVTEKGGTMRLGAYPCRVTAGTKAFQAYGQTDIMERHRHRYEFNNKYIDQMAKQGFNVSGMCPGRDLVEIIELKNHPWFVACQFHPEFQSTPMQPHPLFRDFVAAALTYRSKQECRKAKKS